MRASSKALVALFAVAALSGCLSKPGPEPEPEASPAAGLEISLLDVPAATVLALPVTGPYSEAEGHFEQFARYLLDHGIAPAGDLAGAYFDDPGAVPREETRYEIRIPVAVGSVADAPYRVYRREGFRAAAAKLTGPYEEISRSYGEIYAWIDGQGLLPAGPLIEVYLIHAGSGVPPAEYETEVLVPVEPRP